MNSTTLEGQGNDLTGSVKEGVGSITGDKSLESEGQAQQLTGNVQKGVGKAKDFAKKRPFAAAALFGVVGLAVLNTLRGK